MATTYSLAWGTTNQSLTTHFGGVTNNSAKSSAALDVSAASAADVLIQFSKLKSGASSTSSTGYVNVWVSGTVDSSTPTYGEGVTADAAVTLVSPTNLRPLDKINVVANATTYKSNPVSVANAFGGVLPDHFIVVIENKTGGTLDATDGNHAIIYQIVKGNGA